MKLSLQTAIYRVRKEKKPIREERIRIEFDGQPKDINIEVVPMEIPQYEEPFFIVLFEEAAAIQPQIQKIGESNAELKTADGSDIQIMALMQELESNKREMQTLIEKYEAANEEFRAAMEEAQSSNEELMSTNEELETSKEELQSTNEEMQTLNEELKNRNQEITKIYNDLNNLFNSIEMSVIILDEELKIRNFNPGATKSLNLIPSDLGRPIQDVRFRIDIPDLESMIFDVINNLSTKEKEVQDENKNWYKMQIRPYLTIDKKVEGALLSFVDITEIVRINNEVKKARDYAQAIVYTIQEPLLVLDLNLRVISANHSFYEKFRVEQVETENRLIYELGENQWDIPELRELLNEILPKQTIIGDYMVDHVFPKIGRKVMLLNAKKLALEDTSLILLAIDDITERIQMAQLEDTVREKSEELKTVQQRLIQSERLAAVGQTAGMVGHDIRNPLQTIVGALYLTKEELKSMPYKEEDKEKILKRIATIEEQSQYINKIVSDLQDYTKPLKMELKETDLHQLINDVLSTVTISKEVKVSVAAEEDIPKLKVEPSLIKRVFTNLILNAAQAMPSGGQLNINVSRKNNEVFISFKDTGIGIPEENKPKIFQPLFTTKAKGQGLGLAVVKRLIEAHNGEISFKSMVGKGSTFTVKLPLTSEEEEDRT